MKKFLIHVAVVLCAAALFWLTTCRSPQEPTLRQGRSAGSSAKPSTYPMMLKDYEHHSRTLLELNSEIGALPADEATRRAVMLRAVRSRKVAEDVLRAGDQDEEILDAARKTLAAAEVE